MKRDLLRGAGIIAAGGLISKIIGALYRVPLTNIVGAEAIGLYQTVFPIYTALLALSSVGIPTALSKLVAEGKDGDKIISGSFVLFGGLGLAGSLFMCVLGGFFASLQGTEEAKYAYIALSPSVFAVSLISCARGYFQGKGNMRPTAVSQIAEQVVKAGFGIAACSFFRENAALAAAFAALAVTVSEAAALLYLMLKLKFNGFKRTGYGEIRAREILSVTVPVALSAMLLPLGHLADSFIVVNAMKSYEPSATALFGIYSGSVAALSGLPVALAYGAAVACVPALSEGEHDKKIADAMRFTGFIAIPSAIFLLAFAPRCIDLLYGGMAAWQRDVAARVLMLDSASVILLSFLQTANALLLAEGKQKISVYASLASLVLRVTLCTVFVSVMKIGISGAVIAANLSYIPALAVGLYFALPRRAIPRISKDALLLTFCSILCVLGGFLLYRMLPDTLGFLCAALFSAAFYLLLASVSARLGGKSGRVFNI